MAENSDTHAPGQLYDLLMQRLAENSEDIGTLEKKVYTLELAEERRRGANEAKTGLGGSTRAWVLVIVGLLTLLTNVIFKLVWK